MAMAAGPSQSRYPSYSSGGGAPDPSLGLGDVLFWIWCGLAFYLMVSAVCWIVYYAVSFGSFVWSSFSDHFHNQAVQSSNVAKVDVASQHVAPSLPEESSAAEAPIAVQSGVTTTSAIGAAIRQVENYTTRSDEGLAPAASASVTQSVDSPGLLALPRPIAPAIPIAVPTSVRATSATALQVEHDDDLVPASAGATQSVSALPTTPQSSLAKLPSPNAPPAVNPISGLVPLPRPRPRIFSTVQVDHLQVQHRPEVIDRRMVVRPDLGAGAY
jgi:hypothetical protein